MIATLRYYGLGFSMSAVMKQDAGKAGEQPQLWLDPVCPQGIAQHMRIYILLAVMAALIFLFLMPLFEAPFERDQGTYATIARGWMNGAVPYRDLWDNKGPLLFLWYIASFTCLGENIVAPRIAAALAAGCSMIFVWAAARRLFGRRNAIIAAILFALSFANLYLQVSANAEVFMLLPLTAGFWAFVMGTKSNKGTWFALAGVLISFAVFTRQSAIWTFVGFGIWLAAICLRQPEERKHQFWAIVCLTAGGILGALPFILYFVKQGSLYDLWFAMFGFNIGWAAFQSFWLKLVPPLFVEPGPLFGGLIFWILAAVGCRELWKKNNRDAWLVISLLAVSEAAAQTMGIGSAHYSIQLLPGAAIAAALGLPRMMEWWKSGGSWLRAGFASAAAISVVAILFAYAKPSAEERFIVQYTFRDYADDAIGAPAIAEAVALRSAPGEFVYEWGRSSQIYFLANRQPGSNWFYNRPYEVDKSMIAEVMTDLQKRKPAVIYDTADIPLPVELEKFISKNYRYAGQVNYAKLYQLLGK
ncbi:MAG: glycosyltransferase family 39 protein [Acidobacteria bacterium]|nr:glycosyltransferase family 39 protein [Acidobacteriota bacterium]